MEVFFGQTGFILFYHFMMRRALPRVHGSDRGRGRRRGRDEEVGEVLLDGVDRYMQRCEVWAASMMVMGTMFMLIWWSSVFWLISYCLRRALGCSEKNSAAKSVRP